MNHKFFIKQCYLLAKEAKKNNEVPVGSLITQNNKIIANSYNSPIKLNDPTAHAEINVIREACKKNNNYRIKDSILYTSLEPCLMCLVAACEARIDLIVFGAYSSENKNIEDKFKYIKENYKIDHKLSFIGGILEKECSLIIKDFFKSKRS